MLFFIFIIDINYNNGIYIQHIDKSMFQQCYYHEEKDIDELNRWDHSGNDEKYEPVCTEEYVKKYGSDSKYIDSVVDFIRQRQKF